MTDAEIVAAEIRAAEVPMSDALGAALDRLERDAERYRAMLDDEIALRRGVRRHARCWRGSDGLLEIVETVGNLTRVIYGAGYVRPGSIACELTDTGNGFVVRLPRHGSHSSERCLILDYSQARELVLALSPHARALGFAA